MANRESRHKKLNWLVNVIVIAAVALLVMASIHDADGLTGRLSHFMDNLRTQLWDDPPSVTASAPQLDVSGKDTVRVHFIDVGQGKSILIEAPEKTVLIDAGENNMGETVLLYLNKQKLPKLDIAVGTHPHSDHIGGLDTVIRSFPVEKVILPAIPESLSPTTPTYMDLLRDIAAKKLKITAAKAGDEYELGGGATFTILGPVGNDYSDLNDFSIVSRLDYGATSFLFTGDATSKSESDLLIASAKLRADVLDVGHHGSRDSSSHAFLKEVKPQMAVISCAVDNSYGHPHRQTMERIEELGSVKTVLRTDLDGSVIVQSDGKSLSYSSEETQTKVK